MDPFVYLARYRVVVCEKCGFACVSDEVPTHLLSKHRDLPITKRRTIAEAIAKLPHVRRNQTDLVDFEFPPPTAGPIPQLSPPQTNGLKCRRCPYVVRHKKMMKKHCRECHKWQNMQGRGRPRLDRKDVTIGTSGLAPELPWRDNVHCQRFFLSRAASGWFEVERKAALGKSKQAREGSTKQLPNPNQLPPETRGHIQEVLERHEKYMGALNQPRHYAKALGEESLTATSPWLERTQWRTIYKNARRDILRAMTRLPVREHGTGEWKDMVLGQGAHEDDDFIISPWQDEQKLACMLGAIDLMIDRCETTSKAFSVMTEPSTKYRYRTAWKQFLIFVIRGFLMTSTNRDLVKIRLFPELIHQLNLLWKHRVWEGMDMRRGKWPKLVNKRYETDDFVGHWESDDSELAAMDEVMSGDDSQNEPSPTSMEDMEEEFEEGLEDELNDFHDNNSEEDLENESEAEVYLNDRHPEKNSCQEAAELEVLELLFKLSLTLSTQQYLDGHPGSTLLVYFTGIFGFSADCRRFKLARQFSPALAGPIYCSRLIFLEYALPLFAYSYIGISQRPSTRQVEHLRSVCDKYTVVGSPSPLAELISLRNFGYVIARTEPPAYLLRWSDDGENVSLGDLFTLSMSAFRQLIDYFISRAEQLCDDLMYNWSPGIHLSDIKDDISNAQPGYSFISHPKNNFEDEYRILLARACTCRSSQLRQLAGHDRWRWTAVKEYIKSTKDLEETFAGGLLTACGQTPRLRELFSIECENSPSALRNILFWNGKMMYVLRHHKAKRSTNHEFHVARFLPARLAMVLTKYLVYIRRVAGILRREELGYTERRQEIMERSLLFQSNKKAWPASRMTTILKNASINVCQHKITPQMYRQVAIGITEKHVREVHTPFNRYDDFVARIASLSEARICQRAVKPGAGVKSHFSHIHRVKGEQLKDIADYANADSLHDPNTIELPADWSEPVPIIKIEHGFSCNSCRYLTRSEKNALHHWKESQHNRGGPKYSAVKLQSWTPTKRARYWIINVPGDSTVAPLPPSGPEESAMDNIIAESQAELLEEDTKRNEHGNRQEGIDFDSTWVKHMKWVRHFGDRNLLDIHDAAQGIRARASKAKTRAPEDEMNTRETQLLTRLGESFDREVDRCSWRLSSVPDETLQCLRGIEPGKPHQSPFRRTTKDKSQARYQAVGHRYLEFCWRAYQLGREEAASQLAMRFTDEQWSLMGDVAHELEDEDQPLDNKQAEQQNDSGFFSGDDDDSDGSENWGDDEWEQIFGHRETAVMGTRSLDQAVFQFMIASIKVRVGGDMYSNAMLCFCAATGIRRHPLGFTEAYLYTGVLAALAWLARLFFLEAGFENVSPEEHGIGVKTLDRFKEDHARWMCVGTYTVMSKIINWMAYGKGHRNKTVGPPTVRWTDNYEALMHNGERLVVRDFQRAACTVMVQADNLLNQLLGGRWDRIGPGIDMKRIVDSTSRVGAGHSFATNDKNAWLEVGPGKVLRSMEASIFDKKTNQWKQAGVRRWMRWLRVFREALMLLSHIWEGQPGRGPETATLRQL
ncbi:hypothetical protein VFPPC_12026 [Pochonia chlamydosporia 170]|uniref:C2H2-type domain-containing protein n=1 Tax=Pochonia chlamydosporia 170 TaxID=1380566 RepID=A0A179G375_METCM|nr:hypothetical protein VFPPC_12026 [Pochonia chlamydosporia 170]OAQ71908.1 hypothetical protein VFPPC_12026 [Pochonia chlamydosporia 170]